MIILLSRIATASIERVGAACLGGRTKLFAQRRKTSNVVMLPLADAPVSGAAQSLTPRPALPVETDRQGAGFPQRAADMA